MTDYQTASRVAHAFGIATSCSISSQSALRRCNEACRSFTKQRHMEGAHQSAHASTSQGQRDWHSAVRPQGMIVESWALLAEWVRSRTLRRTQRPPSRL
jgi:hypothetical protein